MLPRIYVWRFGALWPVLRCDLGAGADVFLRWGHTGERTSCAGPAGASSRSIVSPFPIDHRRCATVRISLTDELRPHVIAPEP
jgi:hypothetical protein